MVGTILEGTIVILVLGLILANADNFSKAVQAIAGAYTSAVQTLAGVARG